MLMSKRVRKDVTELNLITFLIVPFSIVKVESVGLVAVPIGLHNELFLGLVVDVKSVLGDLVFGSTELSVLQFDMIKDVVLPRAALHVHAVLAGLMLVDSVETQVLKDGIQGW